MPRKKKETCSKTIDSYFKTTGPGSSSSVTAMETQLGGAAGPRPGGAAGPRPGGAAGPRPGGAAGTRPGGAAGPRPGGAAGTRPGGAAGPRPGGAAGPRPGGAAGTRPGGAERSPPGEATGSQTDTCSKARVKKEDDGDSTGEHLHNFTVKCSPTDLEEYSITCDQPRTVLEAIQSSLANELRPKANIVIQLGKGDKAFTVATHFPCSCICEGESLVICESEKVEEAQDQLHQTVHSRDEYSVFFIDTVGGLFTKQKKLFISNAVKQFKYLCVYGEKGMTVEEALKRDGRFTDGLTNFTLTDNKNPSSFTKCTEIVDKQDGKKFKIRLPRNKRSNKNMQEKPCASDISQQRRERETAVLEVLQQRGTSVRAAVANKDKHVNTEEIYRKLREQYPDLKELMENRFPDDSYQKALELRREDFGKIQRLFNKVHRVRELIKLGESVCKVVVKNVREGTGFVLFDNFILTNAHLLKGCVEGGKLKEGIDVYFFFNYEDPEPNTKYFYFQLAHHDICYSQDELDYAILEINPQAHIPNQATQTEQIEVPPGLLQKFGPLPLNGEACIVGHPAGGLKQMDPTCIIEKEKREQAVHDHLQQYKDSFFIVSLITDLIKKQGIENIMIGGNKADNVATYNTFMYHGSSGSPVFDAHGRVFGLHTAGFTYVFLNHKESVIEYAQPLLTIFKHFVSQLKQSGNEALLKRVEKEAKRNSDLKKVLNATSTDDQAETDDPEDTSEPMTF